MLQLIQVALVSALVGCVFSAPHSLVEKAVRGDGEAGAATADHKHVEDGELTADDASGRKLLDSLPPDLAETNIQTRKPVGKGEAEIIAEIENILSQVREQYNKENGQALVPPSMSISDLLKLSSTSQTSQEKFASTGEEDPVIEEARQRYMSVWNQEADRLNAPYMRVTKAWPELGIVYMPEVTRVTEEIKASEVVKEAAEEFKRVWEKRVTKEHAANATVEPVLKVLNNFMSAWLWAETVDKETAAGKVDSESDNIEKRQVRVGAPSFDRPKTVRRLDDSFTGGNFLKDIENQLRELYKKIFHQHQRPQPLYDPEPVDVVDETRDLLKRLGSGKITLTCSVVPESEDEKFYPLADDPISQDILSDTPSALTGPIADLSDIINSAIENPLEGILPANQESPKQDDLRTQIKARTPFPDDFEVVKHVDRPLISRPALSPVIRQATPVQDRLRSPIPAGRPFLGDTAGSVRPIKDPIALTSRPLSIPSVSPIQYAVPLVETREVEIRPIADYREPAAPPSPPSVQSARHGSKGAAADHHFRYPLFVSPDSLDSMESEEVFGYRYGPLQQQRQQQQQQQQQMYWRQLSLAH